MDESRDNFNSNLCSLAWNEWTELGVRGVSRNHQECAVDLEALVVFTAGLGDLDPRLRDEATDWCIRHFRFISSSRLKNLSRQMGEEAERAMGELAANVNAASWARWPVKGKPSPRQQPSTGKSMDPDLTRPALISLRLRGLFGVGARADVIQRLLFEPSGSSLSAAELARSVQYTKRNVAEILDGLKASGLVKGTPSGNLVRFRLEQRAELSALARPLPRYAPEWATIFKLLLVLKEIFEKASILPARVSVLEAHKILRSLDPEIGQLGLRLPQPQAQPEQTWKALTAWAVDLSTRFASTNAGQGARR